MDGNKDESERCIDIALKCISAGHKEKARKFLNKALRLYPSKRATSLLESLDNPSENGDAGTEKNDSDNHARQRNNTSSNSEKKNEPCDYTADQLSAVKRINNCKDVYEILEVSRDFSESDLKKAYRKLALQMHPDKNKAPGATEAFKAVGKSYSILNDKEKRRQYDLYGPELQPSRQSHQEEYTHGFDGDISPEELFNMFFGGSFPSNAAQRRSNHHHHQSHRGRTYYTFREPNQSESGMTLFFQLAPILLLIVLSMLSSFFVSDPIYSMNRNDKYHVGRHTPNLKVTYYVKDDFRIEFKSDLRRIERAVEEEYIGKLRNSCLRERNIKENMLWQAKNYGDKRSYERAMDMKTPSCDSLQSVYS